jgi:SAM-dependent methyltransferase
MRRPVPNSYDLVPYPTWPRLETHPDRLAAVATLLGMDPAPVDRCRVLEIGCGDGGNLIPMAYALPQSRFTGIDLARAPLAAARQTVRALGLRNVELQQADLRKFHPNGVFDYIIAHGLYSWIPPDARDALLALCGNLLAPAGIAFVSYNIYPGRYFRQMLREMTLYHTGGAAALDDARHFLSFLRDAAMVPEMWRTVLQDEIDGALGRDQAGLFHDDLAPINDPVYFHQFVAHAGRYGLQYLGDAHVQEMADHRGVLRALGRDRIAREQYLDFLKLRRFRQTLLCRAGVKLPAGPLRRRVARLAYSSPARVEGEYLEGVSGVRIRAADEGVLAVAGALGAAWPRPVPFAALRDLHPAARDIVFNLCVVGFAEPHASGCSAAVEPGDRPEVSAVARREASRSRFVTNLCHRTLHIDDSTAALLPLVDGTRTHDELARQWPQSGGPGPRVARRHLAGMLDWMARAALLVR